MNRHARTASTPEPQVRPLRPHKEPEDPQAQVRHVKAKKGNKLFNTYIPRFLSDTSNGGFFKRYRFERYYMHIVAITVCSIIYIANTFEAHRLYYYEATLNEQIKELRAKSLTIASIKMTATRESSIFEEITKRNIPLVMPKTPPLVIKVPKTTPQTEQQ